MSVLHGNVVGIQTKIIERVKARYDVKRHPSCDGREYFVSDEHEVHGKMEGSFNSYTGGEVDWLVHSWIGNRQKAFWDINATVLGQMNPSSSLNNYFWNNTQIIFLCGIYSQNGFENQSRLCI